MRLMFVSRSSLLNPSPLLRLVRTSSPSRISTFRPRRRSSSAARLAKVDLPAPESPVNHSVKPFSMRRDLRGIRRPGAAWRPGQRDCGHYNIGQPALAQLGAEPVHQCPADLLVEVVCLIRGERPGRITVFDRERQTVLARRDLPAGIAVRQYDPAQERPAGLENDLLHLAIRCRG